MSHFKEHWFPYLLFFIIGVVIFNGLSTDDRNKKNITDFPNKQKSIIPDIYELSNSDADNLIRYGKILIDSTSHYLGPHGSVAAITNGLNCQNCHRESGTKLLQIIFWQSHQLIQNFGKEAAEWNLLNFV